MSDCPTEAMKPKEPPKKCGECKWWMPDPTEQGRVGKTNQCGACPQSYNDELDYYDTTFANTECMYGYHPEEANGREGLAFEPRTDTLEQRCQQLSKLTQDMHRIIAAAERNGSTIHDGVSARLLERMDALGVEADG